MTLSYWVSCFICMTAALLFLFLSSFIQFQTSCLLVANESNTFSSSASFNNNIFMQYPTYVDTGPIQDAHVTSNNSDRRMIRNCIMGGNSNRVSLGINAYNQNANMEIPSICLWNNIAQPDDYDHDSNWYPHYSSSVKRCRVSELMLNNDKCQHTLAKTLLLPPHLTIIPKLTTIDNALHCFSTSLLS